MRTRCEALALRQLLHAALLLCAVGVRAADADSVVGAGGAGAGAAAAEAGVARWQLERENGRLKIRPRTLPAPGVYAAAAAAPPAAVAGVPRCALLMHFHVQRTGGTHVRALMTRSAESGVWEFVPPTAFRTAWPPLRAAVLDAPNGTCTDGWARRRLLMEVQANSNYRLFMDEVLPHATELRSRFASCGCAFALSVLLREPKMQAVSMYRHFVLPRRLGARAAFLSATPPLLPDWLAKTHDPQTRALLGYNIRASEIGGAFNICTRPARGRALRTLAGFDVVGVTERLPDFLMALSARTGWRETLEGRGSEVLFKARNAQSYEGINARWRQNELTAEEVAALEKHTACDAAVYAAAAAAAANATGINASALAFEPAAPGEIADGNDAVVEARRAVALAALREQHRQSVAAAAAGGFAVDGGPPRCALLVFYHIAKTGGSYVRFLMQASRSAGDWKFHEPEDFRNLTWPFLRDHVLGNATLPLPEACGSLRAQGRLLVEVHANAGFALWARQVAPVLPALRARYASCGCLLTTSIMLREPVAAAVSAYRFFPLRQGLGASLPVEAWIRDNHDPQTKAVLGFNLRPHELPGGQPFAFCSRVAEAGALANLGTFDVVGVTERMDAWLRLLAARTGWVAPAQLVNAGGEPVDVVRVAEAARNAQSYDGEDAAWRRDQLAPATLAALQRHTECDASLFAAAQGLLDDALGNSTGSKAAQPQL